MSIIRIATNFNIELEFPAAPFHRRLLAWVIDLMLLVFYVLLLTKFFEWLILTTRSVDRHYLLRSLFLLLLMVPVFTYHLLCEVFMNGQSLGKKITGIRVVNENGGKPSISQYIIRWVIRTSDYMVMVIIIYAPEALENDLSFFWKFLAAFGLLIADIVLVNSGRKRQRIGDLLAHTILIRTKQESTLEDTVFLQVDPDYTPQYPEVMQLSDRDINALKGILDTARRRHDYAMAELASEKIKTHLNIQTHLSPFDFLEVLLKDYNYLSAQ